MLLPDFHFGIAHDARGLHLSHFESVDGFALLIVLSFDLFYISFILLAVVLALLGECVDRVQLLLTALLHLAELKCFGLVVVGEHVVVEFVFLQLCILFADLLFQQIDFVCFFCFQVLVLYHHVFEFGHALDALILQLLLLLFGDVSLPLGEA